jgi:non-specific serine/threonine protein kinase
MALLLHAYWHRDRLLLWAERSSPTSAEPRLATAEELRAAVGELSPDGLLASVAQELSERLWLPADERGPIACSAAAAAHAGHGGGAIATLVGELRLVSVPALAFTAVQAIDLLTSLPADLTPGCADSVRYWRALAEFVVDLLARRQFVPHINETDAGFVARWRPVVQDRGELDWLEQMVAAMPAACRARAGNGDERGEGDGEGAGIDPSRLVERFLSATCDALIRRAVSEDPFFRQPAERLANAAAAPDTRPPETRWVAALLDAADARVPDGVDEDQTNDENLALAQVVQAWVGQIEPSVAAAAMRLVFRLEEPPDPEDNGQAPTAAQSEAEDAAGDEEDDVAAVTGPWRLRLLLEPESGEGETIDAAELWADGGAAVLVGRSVKNRQARLLGELARAAEVFPLLQPLVQHPQPAALELQTPDAYAFLRQGASLLREQGFGVQLPAWAERADHELGLRLQVRPLDDFRDLDDDENLSDLLMSPRRGGGGAAGPAGAQSAELPSGHFGLDALLQFDWQVAVGNQRLSPDEFRRIAARNTPLVKLRGQWVQIDLEAAKQAASFLEKQKDKSLTLAEALRTAYGATRAETGLPVLGMGGSSWIEQLLEQVPGAKVEAHAQPESFKGTLRPYQLRGLQWLAFLNRLGIGACLADDMGLGKTIQLISLLLHERESGDGRRESGVANPQSDPRLPTPDSRPPTPGPTLLFAPTSVVGNWVRELERFAPELKVLVHHGPDRASGDVFAEKAAAADVVITSYALAHRDREELRRVAWHRLTLDEAQKIKNPSAASTIAIRALTAGRRVAMTGTPIENHLSELWSIMEILNPGLLGPASEFREKFAVPIEKLGDRERSEQLRRLIRPFVLRRLKSDPDIASDLPEKMEAKVFCNLTPEQAAQYERIVGQSLNQIDSATGIRRRGLILSVLTRLKQICDHPSLVLKDDGPIDGRSGKCERLAEMLEELLDEGDAALVFTQFREMGHLLHSMIAKRLGVGVQFLHGGTPAKERDEMIERFQDPANGIKVFVLSLRAGGLGLNLTAANHVFHFDRWWNPAVESQATDRAHRVGQTRKVQVHKFVCIGTMEERIDRLLTEKLALADKIIGSGDEWLTSMSTDQLREYLSLSKEAIGEF